MKGISQTMLALLIICTSILVSNIDPIKATPTTIIVPDNYPTIQAAINAASDGDTIFVKAGTYYENVVVNKSISLVGENKSSTIIDGSSSGINLVELVADNVSVSEFYLRNANAIAIFARSRYNTIANNYISKCAYGIISETSWSPPVYSSHYNRIIGNTVADCTIGIYAHYSGFNEISNNDVTSCYWGIDIHYWGGNTLKNNKITNSSNYNLNVRGSSLADFTSDIDTSNLADGKPVYYLVNRKDLRINPSTFPEIGYLALINSRNVIIENVTLTRNFQGLLVAYSNDVIVKNANISNNGIGIDQVNSDNNTFVGNIIANNGWGLSLSYACLNNTIVGNSIAGNLAAGIVPSNTPNSRNVVFHNDFVNNHRQVFSYPSAQQGPDLFNDTWDDGYPSGGNYWSDYNGTDLHKGPYQNETGSDGIGDTPYIIDSNNTDHYPLMQPWSPPAASPNLLVNSGFEEGLTGWNASAGAAVYSVDSTTSHPGNCSVKGVETNDGSLGRLYQDVTSTVSPGNQYQISGWIKTANVTGPEGPVVVIGLGYVDANGMYPADAVTGETKEEIGAVNGTQDWTFYRSPIFTLQSMPIDAVALWFLFDFNGGAGTAWWDDVSLARASAVTTVTSTKTVVGQSFSTSLNVTMANQSNFTQTFNVTAYANTTCLGSEVITLGNNSLTIVTFPWNSSGFAYGNYTISIGAADSNFTTAENNFAGGFITVSIPGDINGDFKIDLKDLVILASAYGSKLGDAKWNSNADVDGNGAVGLSDLVVLAQHYGQH